MGLWQGGGSAGQAGGWRDARRGRGGQEWVGMEGERSKGEGKKKACFVIKILIFLFQRYLKKKQKKQSQSDEK